MRIIEDRAASGTELLSTLFLKALKDANSLVVSGCLAYDYRDFKCPTVDTSYAFGPAGSFEVGKALFVGSELFCYVYEIHSEKILA